MSEKYFSELKEWSARKHELLIAYLKGFTRILGGATGLVYYVDGFAGPGLYGDGQKGSPLIAAEYARSLIGKHYTLNCINIELGQDLYNNLVQNTVSFHLVTTNLCGSFADHIDDVIKRIGDRPTIFFIDPFGIKGIEWRHISKALTRPHITELLVRVNQNDIERLAGFFDSGGQGAASKLDLLRELYGLPNLNLLEQVWKAEKGDGLAKLYMKRIDQEMTLSNKLVYVHKYPIRAIEGSTKYYLVFATRHPKGAILMNDTIYNREENYDRDREAYEFKKKPQISLFDLRDLLPPKEDELKEDIWQSFKGKSVSRFIIREAMLQKWFGRVKGTHFTNVLNDMKDEGLIINLSGPPSQDDTLIVFKA